MVRKHRYPDRCHNSPISLPRRCDDSDTDLYDDDVVTDGGDAASLASFVEVCIDGEEEEDKELEEGAVSSRYVPSRGEVARVLFFSLYREVA